MFRVLSSFSSSSASSSMLLRQPLRSFSAHVRPKVVGFVGLGNMGGHMAHNLLSKGHKLVVYDVSADAVSRAVKSGATAAKSLKELAQQSTAVITMLPSSPHVKDVYLAENGLLSGAHAGTLFVDSSTIDPYTARSVNQESVAKKCFMVDAPVSGGVGGAEKGTLTFMVGGTEAAFTMAKDLLQHMGKNIVHCGDSGTGQVAKICNNLVLAVSMVGVSEGMNLGVKLGMDPKKLAGIFNTSTARCWSSDTYNPCPGVMENVPSSRGYTGGFGVDLMKKDLGLAIAAAAQSASAVPAAASVHQLYSLLSAHGLGQHDFSVMYEWLAGKRGNTSPSASTASTASTSTTEKK